MPLKTETIEEPSLNLTPMIDIVFLLIIFFMVGAQFSEQERLFELNLPKVADAPPLSSLPDDIIVNVKQNGQLVVNGAELSLQELVQKLTQAKQNYDEQGVVIRADADSSHQHFMNVMTACRTSRIHKIGVASQLDGKSQLVR